ncbi:hypothetical protein SDC9_107124 [bioreactor metagenome]|uniref:DUF2851 domain-containing protein n=1 Tax=bioreactor metagenome TaxID=1076179 RepID=A0A645BAT7_9ZZZZ
MNIPETFIHYVWEKGLAGQHFTLDTGDECQILKPGKRGNRDGPDFENTELVIGRQRLAGNAEIHLRSSDWFRHGHHTDPVYDKTILHIVLKNDAIICNKDGKIIPAVVLPEEDIEKLFQSCRQNGHHNPEYLRCAEYVSLCDPTQLMKQLKILSISRTEKKVTRIMKTAEQSAFDWTEVAWKTLSSAFGLSHNTVPMEWLSNSLSWKTLCRAGNVFSCEALLLGQAGFLQKDFPADNGYMNALRQEFTHLQNKFSLTPIDIYAWKYSPVRPSSMPETRLAQIAALVSKVPDLFSQLSTVKKIKDLYRIFRQPVSGYWKNHWRPETGRQQLSAGKAGKTSVDVWTINAVVPLLIAFSRHTGRKETEENALHLLNCISPEQNKIIDIFVRNAGLKVSNAFETQGVIELYSSCCSIFACTTCPVMKNILCKNQP